MSTLRSIRSLLFLFVFPSVILYLPAAARAGFEAPPGLPTTVKDTPILFLGQTDYRPPGTGIVSFAGFVRNWDPNGTEAPMGGGKFQIDVTGSHSVGPHGEAVPGPQLRLSFMDVVSGGAAQGPDITSATAVRRLARILLQSVPGARACTCASITSTTVRDRPRSLRRCSSPSPRRGCCSPLGSGSSCSDGKMLSRSTARPCRTDWASSP
jgi:hypothetical protein